jgi:hypothetical protein
MSFHINIRKWKFSQNLRVIFDTVNIIQVKTPLDNCNVLNGLSAFSLSPLPNTTSTGKLTFLELYSDHGVSLKKIYAFPLSSRKIPNIIFTIIQPPLWSVLNILSSLLSHYSSWKICVLNPKYTMQMIFLRLQRSLTILSFVVLFYLFLCLFKSHTHPLRSYSKLTGHLKYH